MPSNTCFIDSVIPRPLVLAEKDPDICVSNEAQELTCDGWQVTLSEGKHRKPALAWARSLRIPPPRTGNVRVRLLAAGISPLDALLTFDGNKEYPCGVGLEGAGIIESINFGVEHDWGQFLPSETQVVCDLRPGDAVVLIASKKQNLLGEERTGTFSSFLNVDVSRVVKIPKSTSCVLQGDHAAPLVDFADAATIPVTGASAHLVLKEKLKVERGRSIFIHGASGGTGSVMVQLAHHFGLHVIASCATAHVDYLRGLGADVVADYSTMQGIVSLVCKATNRIGVDYAVDCTNTEGSEDLTKLLRFGGSLCVLSNRNRAHTNFFDLWHRQISIHYISLFSFLETTHGILKWRKAVDEMFFFYSSGIIDVFVEEVPLSHACVALDVIRSEHVMGKLVLTHPYSTKDKDNLYLLSTFRTKKQRPKQKIVQ